jgi:hypothetical protein
MSEWTSGPLWCPNCGGRENTPVADGLFGFSQIEVTCDDCGEQYVLAINVSAWLARAEQDRRT